MCPRRRLRFHAKGKTLALPWWCFPAAATDSGYRPGRHGGLRLAQPAGVTCVLLKYRVPDTGPYPKSAAALQDAQRAMGLVRLHAAEWGIDPHRVGVLGFSAGGHLSAAISNHYDKRLYDPIDDADKLSCRPDFSVVVYPGYLALARSELRAQPRHSSHREYAADVHRAGRRRSGPRGECGGVLHAVEERQGAGRAARLCAGRARLRAAPHRASRHRWPKVVEKWLHTIKMLPANRGTTIRLMLLAVLTISDRCSQGC